MSAITARNIDRVSKGGPIHQGQAIEFVVCFEDGTTDSYQCPYDRIPKIVHSLKQFGEMAEHLQRKAPGPSAEVVSPYRAGGVKVGKSWDGSLVALELRTEEGIPLLISLTPELAERVVVAITKTLASQPFASDSRS